MRLLSSLALVALALAATTTTSASFVQHEALPSIPHGWELHSPVHPHAVHLTYRIAVKQNVAGVKALESYLLDHSSNPSSMSYGVHKTRDEINDMVRPSADSVTAVMEWLAQHGVHNGMTEITDGHDFISFTAPVDVGNRLLNTQFNLYQHKTTGHQVVRTQAYHLPEHMLDHVDFVSPTTRFPHASKNKHASLLGADRHGRFKTLSSMIVADKLVETAHAANATLIPANNNTIIVPDVIPTTGPSTYQPTPMNHTGIVPPSLTSPINYSACANITDSICIKQYYGFANYTVQAASKNSLAATGFLGNYFGANNVAAGLETYVVPYYGANATNHTVTVISVLNGTDPAGEENDTGGEADLDTQVTTQLAYPTPVYFYSTPGFQPDYTNNTAGGFYAAGQNEPYSDWLATLLGQKDVPYVISTSYGDDEDTVGPNYAQRVCTELMELGAQGITLLYASGDNGVGGIGDESVSDGPWCYGPDNNMFESSFPAACPYVTAVGATSFQANGTETATFDPRFGTGTGGYSSGGGFSYLFPRPSYQDTVVNNYLDSIYPLYDGLFNPLGRAYPDISAVGTYFPTYLGYPFKNGTVYQYAVEELVDGTSMSTPVYASIVALINDQRLAANMSTIGFMNVALYNAPSSIFNDITVGSNANCNTNGFSCQAGWDPVTGFGSPKFVAMSEYFMSLGNFNPAPSYTGTPFPTDAFTNPPNFGGQYAYNGTNGDNEEGNPFTAPPANETLQVGY